MRVSIITPVLNGARYIRATLESIRAQSYRDIEHIVVDGGSTDGTLDIVRQYEVLDVRWTTGPDSGQAQAINKGMSMATGDVLIWLNCDDLLLPDSVSSVVAAFGSVPEAEFCYGHADLINSEGRRTKTLYTCRQSLASYQADGGNIFQGTVFFTRKAWDEEGPLDESLRCAFEYRLFDQLFANHRGVFINRILARYRIHGESISSHYPEFFARELSTFRGAPPSQIKREFFRARRMLLTTLDGNLMAKLKSR